jgi:hypothetical protein
LFYGKIDFPGHVIELLLQQQHFNSISQQNTHHSTFPQLTTDLLVPDSPDSVDICAKSFEIPSEKIIPEKEITNSDTTSANTTRKKAATLPGIVPPPVSGFKRLHCSDSTTTFRTMVKTPKKTDPKIKKSNLTSDPLAGYQKKTSPRANKDAKKLDQSTKIDSDDNIFADTTQDEDALTDMENADDDEPIDVEKINTTFDFTAPADVYRDAPAWFKQYQRDTDARFKQFEAVMEENSVLRAKLAATEAALALAKARIESMHATSAVNPDPPSAFGTSASKHAPSTTEFPTPQEAAAKATNSDTAANDTPFAHAAKSAMKKPSAKAKVQARKIAARMFTPLSTSHGYTYVYLPCRARQRTSIMRGTLKALGIDTSRVLDVNYPAFKVVAILVHNDYVETLLARFTNSGIQPVANFNPLDITVLGNSTLAASLSSDEAKLEKTRELHLIRCLRALDFLRKPVCYAVANDFLAKGWITQQHVDQLNAGERLVAERNTDDATTTSEANLKEAAAAFNVNDTADTDTDMDNSTPTGAGEPIPSQ